MKNKLRMGGNPIEDAKEAKERYQMVVKPVLEPQGFKKEGTSTNMYNKLLDTFLIIKSAPSSQKFEKEMKGTIIGIKKKYENPKIKVLFTRDISDYPEASKKSYMRRLKKLNRKNSISGIAVGIGNLPTLIKNINTNTNFKLIS